MLDDETRTHILRSILHRAGIFEDKTKYAWEYEEDESAITYCITSKKLSWNDDDMGTRADLICAHANDGKRSGCITILPTSCIISSASIKVNTIETAIYEWADPTSLEAIHKHLTMLVSAATKASTPKTS